MSKRTTAKRYALAGAGLFALLALVASACGNEGPQNIKVSAAYADNVSTPNGQGADFPSPWQGSPNITFKGKPGEGGGAQQWDAGAIRIENTSGSEVTVDKVTVDVGQHHYDLWGSNKVAANGTLILTQTEINKQTPFESNFDTSEANGVVCKDSGLVPTVKVTVNGSEKEIKDSQKILNTAGKDVGAGCLNNESRQWTPLASISAGNQSSGSNDLLWVPLAAALLALFAFLPALIGALLLLLIGWFLAKTIGRLVATILERLGFGAAAERTGLFGFLRRRPEAGARSYTASWLIGDIVKWFIFLVFVIAAVQTLHLTQLSVILASFLFFLPNLLVALLIIIFGALVAQFVSRMLRGAAAQAGFGNPDLVASVARVAIIAFAVLAAVNQIGIAVVLVNTLWVILVAALAIILGLAFGLGGQQTASELWERWYQSMQSRRRGGA